VAALIVDRPSNIVVGEFAALLAVFTLATALAVRKNRRRKLSPFLGMPDAQAGRVLRLVVCGIMIAAALGVLYVCTDGVKDGRIHVSLSKYNRLGGGFTVQRAENPRGFWMAIGGYGYFAGLFLYLALVEIVYVVRGRSIQLG
jgi:hypothetical protein